MAAPVNTALHLSQLTSDHLLTVSLTIDSFTKVFKKLKKIRPVFVTEAVNIKKIYLINNPNPKWHERAFTYLIVLCNNIDIGKSTLVS